ncbi:MAG TPA: DUF996 domain-containing protein [Oleiagrimonas sp.]|nr:DUF996 domain-containing protein [Oleiagrimonas sp.]
MEHNTKMLGGISCIALVVFSVLGSFIPFVGVLTLIAGICLLVAFFMAGNQLHRSDVKNNVIISIVLSIVGTIVLLMVMGASFAAVLSGTDTGLGAFGATAIIGGIICWIIFIIGSWFWYKASVGIAEGSNTPLFKTGGLVLFIGTILLVVFGIGAIVMLVGQIMQAIAFFNAPENSPASAGSVV